MIEKKILLVEALSRAFPNMTEIDRIYLIGFLDGMAVKTSNNSKQV